jgi:hypothetical protein
LRASTRSRSTGSRALSHTRCHTGPAIAKRSQDNFRRRPSVGQPCARRECAPLRARRYTVQRTVKKDSGRRRWTDEWRTAK